jgi:hypothetical protein
MEDCASLCICKFTKKDVGHTVLTFQQKQGVVPTSEGVIPTKQGKIRKNKPLFCTNQHVANTKFAPKCTFCHKNALFRQLLGYLLLPNLYIHPQGDILVHRDYGLWVQNPAWGESHRARAQHRTTHYPPPTRLEFLCNFYTKTS